MWFIGIEEVVHPLQKKILDPPLLTELKLTKFLSQTVHRDTG